MKQFLQMIFVLTRSLWQLFGIWNCFPLFHLANEPKLLLWSWQGLDSDCWSKLIHLIISKPVSQHCCMRWHNPCTSAVQGITSIFRAEQGCLGPPGRSHGSPSQSPTAWLSLPPPWGPPLDGTSGTAGAGQWEDGAASAKPEGLWVAPLTPWAETPKLTRWSQNRGDNTHPCSVSSYHQTTGKPKVQTLSSGDTCQSHGLQP